ncbi:MAG: sulfotransferase family 2 domain-containing protein [Deltaproteobacteria bacterium]|nr:sulfotransferase family 2 domain-containing protein [Deltaproteobacteria bacterium]
MALEKVSKTIPMKKYDSTIPLISIHIPKCAGTSFAEILTAWFGRGFLQHYPDEKNNKSPKKHNIYIGKHFKPRLCIHGHFNNNRGNGVQDYYPNVDQYIMILRDPFEVYLSNYFYVKRLRKDAYRPIPLLLITMI